MEYISTRGCSTAPSTFDALLQGLGEDGGLFVPKSLPHLTFTADEINHFTYQDYANKIISAFFDDIDKQALALAIRQAYSTFDKEMLPIQKLKNSYVLELYHGATFAFKDFALALLPRLISLALKEKGITKKLAVLTATSGDTGSAALRGFNNVDQTAIFVFYPTRGISAIQKKQMTTINGTNTFAIGVEGNFDDAQKALKKIFTNQSFKKELSNRGYLLSSANSINIGRLVPQIVYYYYAYYQLVKQGEIKKGEEISISVPTGNFGNILAAFLAKKTGLPINNLICASNKNNILTDFIHTGVYNANRPFYQTNSPSMDILISSNLERFLYYTLKNPAQVKELMDTLQKQGSYTIENLSLFHDVKAYSFDDEQTLKAIGQVYRQYNYLIDTHTAVGFLAAQAYGQNSNEKTFIAATASPYKFPTAVAKGLGLVAKDEMESLEKIEAATGQKLPLAFKNLLRQKETQKKVTNKEDIAQSILEVLIP